MTETVNQLLAAIEAGQPVPTEIFAPDIVVDATVPGWRMTLRGPAEVGKTFATWYRDRGQFEELDRTELPGGGEVVRFLLTWTEGGVPHAAHQAHFVELDPSGRIRRVEVFCGGRWDAGLLAEMEEADRVGA